MKEKNSAVDELIHKMYRQIEMPRWNPTEPLEAIGGEFLYASGYDANDVREFHLIREDGENRDEWIIPAKKNSVLDGKLEHARLRRGDKFACIYLGEKISKSSGRPWKDYKIQKVESAKGALPPEQNGGTNDDGVKDEDIPF